MWPLGVLTGFYYKKMYGLFAGTKRSGRNNKVAVRRGFTVSNICRMSSCKSRLVD